MVSSEKQLHSFLLFFLLHIPRKSLPVVIMSQISGSIKFVLILRFSASQSCRRITNMNSALQNRRLLSDMQKTVAQLRAECEKQDGSSRRLQRHVEVSGETSRISAVVSAFFFFFSVIVSTAATVCLCLCC